MASTNFVDNTTVIYADWLNDVDAAIYDVLGAPTTDTQARTNLGLAIGTDVQAYDATLTSISQLGTAADKVAYTTGVDTWAETTVTAAARTILDDATVSDMVNSLGGSASTGTGGLVRENSPTLVTPNIGTPSGGTLSNCTGLPVSTGVSGLGTGIATFLATPSSANLKAAITDETGSGSLVFSDSATLTTPTLGVASATSINKVAITAPATSATLTIANGKTLTANETLTLAGTTGTISFQGTDTYVGRATTDTLTNKRFTPRVGSTTSHANPSINTDNFDIYKLTAQAVDISSFTTNLTGTPTDGQVLIIQITGTAARAITWGTAFEASTIALPTTTVSTNMLTVGFLYNSVTSKWRCMASN